MKTYVLPVLVSATAIALCTGCGTSPSSSSTPYVTAANVDASQYKLIDEPEGAVGVISARQSAVDGAPLVLVGRIGGSANPWIDGRAAFMLLDASMSILAEGEDSGEGELCAGDCCVTERLNCTTLVKVVDDQGQLVPVDSRKLLGLKESDMLVVQGTAQKDKSGNFVMLAKGVYVRK
jgi:hypothetical protein